MICLLKVPINIFVFFIVIASVINPSLTQSNPANVNDTIQTAVNGAVIVPVEGSVQEPSGSENVQELPLGENVQEPPATGNDNENIQENSSEDENIQESLAESESKAPKTFEDLTTFLGGINDWDFEGFGGKFNTSKDNSPILDNASSKNHIVFLLKINPDSPSTAYLSKNFPALKNITVTFNEFFNIPKETSTFRTKATAFNKHENVVIFDYNHGISGLSNVNQWQETFYSIKINKNFQIKIEVTGTDSGIWALDEIAIRGIINEDNDELDSGEHINLRPTPGGPIPTNISILSDNETTSSILEENQVEPNATDISENNILGISEPQKDSDTEEDENRFEDIAYSMWNAFYVFLALFCACLLALIVLVVRNKFREDSFPPQTASYNPRTSSSYQLGKARDNVAYQTDSV